MKPAQNKQDTYRILHIGKYFPPHYGGMETILRDQMHLQSRQNGLEVAAVVHSSERRLLDRLEVTDHGCRLRRSATWFTAIFAPIAPLFWYSVAIEIKKLDPDEIRIHMPNLSAFWLLLILVEENNCASRSDSSLTDSLSVREHRADGQECVG